MFNLHDKTKYSLALCLKKSIDLLYPNITLKIEDIYHGLSIAPNPSLGHFAFGCFILAKATKKSPAQIATELNEKLTTDPLLDRHGPIS